jgi:hypothetical protein
LLRSTYETKALAEADSLRQNQRGGWVKKWLMCVKKWWNQEKGAAWVGKGEIGIEREELIRILSPGGGESASSSVVTSKSVNTALNENELVLLVLVLPELLEMLAHGHSLLDEVVKVFRDGGGLAYWRQCYNELKRWNVTTSILNIWEKGEKWSYYLPLAFKIWRRVLPVTEFTWAMPWESRRMTPIWEGVKPFLASLQMWSVTSWGVVFNQEGGVFL